MLKTKKCNTTKRFSCLTGREDFEKLMAGKYKIVTIEGCHSLNAVQKYLNSGTDNRGVVLSRGLC